MQYRGELSTSICVNKEVNYNKLLAYAVTYSGKFKLEITTLRNDTENWKGGHEFSVGLTNSEINFNIEHKLGSMYITNIHICDHKDNVTVEELKEKHDYIIELLNR